MQWPRRGALPLPVVGLILGVLGCSSPEAPTTLAGTYHLISYNLGATDLPLPYVQEANAPGDTDKWVGATLTLQPDSTWTNVFQHEYCPSGACGALHADTSRGTFRLVPGTGPGTTLLMELLPYGSGSGGAVIRGHRLELYNFWIYQR